MESHEVPSEDLDVLEEVAEVVEQPKPSNKKIEVEVLPANMFKDFYLAVTVSGYPEAYLLDKDQHELQAGVQKIAAKDLDKAPKAFDFGPVVADLLPSVGEFVFAMYRAGIVDVKTLSEGQRYRNALMKATPRLKDIIAALS